MVRSARHGYDKQSLNQHGYTEGVHCKASGIDLEAEDVDDALPTLRVVGLEESLDGRGHGRGRDLAGRGAIGKKYSILASELLEGHRYEGANTAYYKDLAALAGSWGW